MVLIEEDCNKPTEPERREVLVFWSAPVLTEFVLDNVDFIEL